MSAAWRFCRDRSANISVLAAMGLALSALASVFAVDEAALYHQRRTLQNAADLAALTAAADPGSAQALAEEALAGAGLWSGTDKIELVVRAGRYDPDPALPPANRFMPGGLPTNAVSVQVHQDGALYLAQGWAAAPRIGAQAVATVSPIVSFSVGSRLASFEGGVANGVLDTLLGTTVALNIVDYRTLVGAEVDLFGFLDALGGELGVTAGSYNDLLSMRADHGQLAKALANGLSGTQRAAMLRLAAVAGHNGTLPLDKLVFLGPLGRLSIGTGGSRGLAAGVGALDLLSASASLSDGTHQVALAMGATVPGLLGVQTALAVGEPALGGAWFGVGAGGTTVRTAQARLRVVGTMLGSGALLGAPVRLPLYVDLASAQVVVGAATCPNADQPGGTATLLVQPGAAAIAVGEVNTAALGDFGTTPTVSAAKLVEVAAFGVPVLRVFASALVDIRQSTPIALHFTSDDVEHQTLQTARTTTLVTSPTTSLLDTLTLNVPILGLGLNISSLRTLLRTILLPVAPTLDLAMARLLDGVGVGLGETDVRVHEIRCLQPVLVG
mgnify:CR=1 FL=1